MKAPFDIQARAGPEPNSVVVDIRIPLSSLVPGVLVSLGWPSRRAVRRAAARHDVILAHLRSRRAMESFGRSQARAGGPGRRSFRVLAVYAPGARTGDVAAAIRRTLLSASPWAAGS